MENLLIDANHQDVSSLSNFDKIRQQHIKLNALIDFSKKNLTGTVDISFKVLDKEERRVILDSKALLISSVKDSKTGKDLKWSLYSEENPDKDTLGTPLVILLNEEMVDSEFILTIQFTSTEDSEAIQWLEPRQTLSKKYPFMFTQCEAILARTLIPCQDSPSAKVTVEANLTVEKPLIALYSGIEVGRVEGEGNLVTYQYVQKVPVPTYLIAIASGELEYGKISDRCGVWTEVGLKDKAVWEFANTEDFLKTGESYLTPYVWGVYNILVLPFAFPYGGMENPCLTFVTPALLAGDRSMTNVIAHEIAHSWTGNLVTNKDWTNFWMNEGFTTFMERKICELMFGEEMANLEACVGKDELKYAIGSFGVDHDFTRLAPDFRHIDPDDAFSTVPYEKGYTLIYFLESLVGKPNFQKIMQTYIQKYAQKSISSKDFICTYETEVKNLYGDKAESDILSKIDWDKWINTTGFPIMDITYKSSLVDDALDLANQFLESKFDPTSAKEKFKSWHTNVKLVFLAYLDSKVDCIDEKVYTNLRDVLNLHDECHNAEVKHVWYPIALKTKHDDVIPLVKKFLLSQGRMKYIRPVYYAWYPFQKEECLDFFDKNK